MTTYVLIRNSYKEFIYLQFIESGVKTSKWSSSVNLLLEETSSYSKKYLYKDAKKLNWKILYDSVEPLTKETHPEFFI